MKMNIEAITYSKSFFKPGELVKAAIVIAASNPPSHTRRSASGKSAPKPVFLVASFSSIADILTEIRHEISPLPDHPEGKAGDEGGRNVQVFELSWQPPATAPKGYGLDMRIETAGGEVLASASSAFDVLESWTQNPRYGFLSDFYTGRDDAAETMTSLTGYHINALQFYDWMYRHEQFLTDQEPYVDLFGRSLSRKTVDEMIVAAHQRGIAAMPYTAVYACSLDFYKQHPDWAMYNPDGTAHIFIEGKMVYMDPRPGSPWMKHLLVEFDDVLARTFFDGIHLDQYGDPKTAYDSQGNPYDVGTCLVEIINVTHNLVAKHRQEGGAVAFNAVGNWPIEKVAPAGEDIVYIEVWPPYTSLTDLHELIAQAQVFGYNKPVVLAAYIDPAMQVNARLMAAIIFASGGSQITLGEKDGYLADPYFPRYKKLTPELSAILKRTIEFAIRYQDVFGPAGREVTPTWQKRITLQDTETSPNISHNKIYPLVRENDRFTAVSLINLLGLTHDEWCTELETPRPQGATRLKVREIDRPVRQVWFGSPDGPDIGLRPLDFSQQASTLSLDVPSLDFWAIILIEWGD
jgi:dextranase